jgi:hypothetical protein
MLGHWPRTVAFAAQKDDIAAAVRHLSKTAPGDSLLIKDLAGTAMFTVEVCKALVAILLMSSLGASSADPVYPPQLQAKPLPMQQATHAMGVPVGKGMRYYVGLSDSLPGSDPLAKALRDAGDGPQVLECEYGRGPGYKYGFYFWHRSVPRDLIAQDKSGYLRWYGVKALEKCPATIEEAREIRRANVADRGFPG